MKTGIINIWVTAGLYWVLLKAIRLWNFDMTRTWCSRAYLPARLPITLWQPSQVKWKCTATWGTLSLHLIYIFQRCHLKDIMFIVWRLIDVTTVMNIRNRPWLYQHQQILAKNIQKLQRIFSLTWSFFPFFRQLPFLQQKRERIFTSFSVMQLLIIKSNLE